MGKSSIELVGGKLRRGNPVYGERDDAGPKSGPVKRSKTWRTVLVTAVVTFLLTAVAATTGALIYWERQKKTPQYSLALMIDAARNNDDAGVGELIDIDAVVDDFVPQITDKAVELYGRGIPPETIRKIARIAEPVMPAVKERALAELPGAIRSKTSEFNDVPFTAMVLGAERYLDIIVEGEKASVKSRDPEQRLELLMVRNGSKWKIAGLRDEDLAERIAQAIGQEIIDIAVNGPSSGKSRTGLKNINQLLRDAEELFK